MKLTDSAQMKALDKYAIETLKIPSDRLMENAADGLVLAVKRAPAGPVSVLCGSGNNGGDGVCCARKLMRTGRQVRVFLVGKPEKRTPDFLEMQRRLQEAGGIVEDYLPDSPEQADWLNGSAVIVDALLGTGLNAPLRGAMQSAVRAINAAPGFVIAADMPTGVSADTGLIFGEAVRADETLTFTRAKIGQFSEPGCTCCGKVTVWDIGIPREQTDALPCETYAFTAEDAALPRRRQDTHKGDYGRDLILAGSVGYTGAPVMAAEAASRMGAGLVYLGVPDSIYSLTALRCLEVMPMPVPCDEDGLISWQARGFVAEMLEKCSVCLAGPGMGQSYQLQSLIEYMLTNSRIPLVLDADALNALSGRTDILKQANCPVVLTPHPGEFARLGGNTENGRVEAARAFAEEYGVILVLKGHRTVTAMPDGRVFLNTSGGPALAKGGSGDVLAGMVAALLGQGFEPEKAVPAAVYLHGLAGDLCADRLGEYSVTAGDLLAAVGEAVLAVQRASS